MSGRLAVTITTCSERVGNGGASHWFLRNERHDAGCFRLLYILRIALTAHDQLHGRQEPVTAIYILDLLYIQSPLLPKPTAPASVLLTTHTQPRAPPRYQHSASSPWIVKTDHV